MDEEWIRKAIGEIRKETAGGKVLLALSGGVDSSVCAALLDKAVKGDFFCVFVDTGLMRKDEPEQVREAMERIGVRPIMIDAKDKFLNALKGVDDPERKRKIIGEQFIRVFEEESRKLGKIDFLAQGTIRADIIESGKEDGKELVKSHHNVGGLPEKMDIKEIIEPLKTLYKNEVRSLGLLLGLPAKIVGRQPFPGPGLAVRIIGEITREKLDMLREADAVFREEMEKEGLDGMANQYFAVLTNIKSVGMEDGKRTYLRTVALRAVASEDFLTASAVPLPFEFLHRVGERITGQVRGVNRVLYDITDKPRSTVEFE